jgi:hypothetical protein
MVRNEVGEITYWFHDGFDGDICAFTVLLGLSSQIPT